jgi:hypothetical protein
MFAPSINVDLEKLRQPEEKAAPSGKKVAAKGRAKVGKAATGGKAGSKGGAP